MTTVEIRRLESAQAKLLEPEVERAREAGEFRASSDPDARFFLRSFEFEGHPVAVAVGDDGSIGGFISPEFKLLVVRPELRRQAIGRRLVEAAVDIERERGRPNVLLGRLPDDGASRAFLEATGFSYHSTLWDLALPSGAGVAAPVWPDGLTARPFEQARDPRSFQQLFNASFADHPTPLQISDAAVDAPPEPGIDDADTVLLEDASGELVGFCATTPERVEGVPGTHAEIWAIGVRPDRQGHGAGRQLLRWGVQRLRSIGVTDISLSVNALNDHALGLYESEGFRRTATRERWARPVAAPS